MAQALGLKADARSVNFFKPKRGREEEEDAPSAARPCKRERQDLGSWRPDESAADAPRWTPPPVKEEEKQEQAQAGDGVMMQDRGDGPSWAQTFKMQWAIEAAERGLNLFITGAGGVGKTELGRELIRRFTAPDQRRGTAGGGTAVCAPTGIAAQVLNAETVHSMLSLSIQAVPEDVESVTLDAVRLTAKQREFWRRTGRVVIDEVSMLAPALFLFMHYQAQHARGRYNLPFGGVQIIVVGDFFQLPPVWTRRDAPRVRFAFQLPLWFDGMFHERALRAGKSAIVVLHEVMRQTNVEFIERLGRVRRGQATPADFEWFAAKRSFTVALPPGLEPTRLYPHRRVVDEVNRDQLARLPGEVHTYRLTSACHSLHGVGASAHDRERCAANAVRNHPVLEVTELKVGAQVMLMRNINVQRGLCNGSRGVVIGFVRAPRNKPSAVDQKAEHDDENTHGDASTKHDDDEKGRENPPPSPPVLLSDLADPREESRRRRQHLEDKAALAAPNQPTFLPVVHFATAEPSVIVVNPCTWQTEVLDGRALVVINAIPLKLAWAVTVHKSQGMSIDCLSVGLRDSFEAGMVYVALSRARNPDALLVESIDQRSLNRVDGEVVAYYEHLEHLERVQNTMAPPPPPPPPLMP